MARQHRRRIAADEVVSAINTTPLVDVMLVLLIIFLITIPVVNFSVPVSLPKERNAVRESKPEVLKIDVDAHNVIHLNGEPVLGGKRELLTRLSSAATQPVPPEVHLRADRHAKYNTFAEVMVAVNQVGLSKVGVVGSEQFITQ
ncbi:ExbD/TolR family protein [Roseateles sp. BYS180W]|uniref:ExbD/TolR family protein n=1 Tax=Roseateles rivi TaxID=3299028 RepID=A0ABW7FU99_9BURK